MKTSALFALLLAVSVSARALAPPTVNRGDVKQGGVAVAAAPVVKGGAGAAKAGAAKTGTATKKGAAAAKGAAAKGGKSSAKSNKGSGAAAAASNSTSASASNSTASSASNNNNNSTASASNSTAAAGSGTASASSATRTRACDMGDQSLAGGLQASVLIGIGQQASVITLQGASAAADFSTGVTRLQQFVDTAGLQLQMAQGIADSGSFAQTQLKLLAASQTSQASLVKSLSAAGATAASSNATLTQLLQSFLDSTNNAQDGAEQALIDCFIPLNAVSG